MDFLKTMTIAASGLRAQAGRMRIISENIANADSTPATPGANPYRRKVPTFNSELDRSLEARVVSGSVCVEVLERVLLPWNRFFRIASTCFTSPFSIV